MGLWSVLIGRLVCLGIPFPFPFPATNHSFPTGNHRTSSPLMGCWPSSIAQLVSTICLGRLLITGFLLLITDFLLLIADFLLPITVLLLLINDFLLVTTPFLPVTTGLAPNGGVKESAGFTLLVTPIWY